MRWILAFHIIFVVCWFAGIFYLPRLFVYHAMSEDAIGSARFKVMERKLYYGIMWPSAVLTTLSGLWLIALDPVYYFGALWMHAKMILVVVLWAYHLYCGHQYKIFRDDANRRSHVFFRWLNEVPTVLLIVIVILAVVKP